MSQHKSAKLAEDLGRFHCIECAKWFEGENNLVQHRKGKNHKKRHHSLGLGASALPAIWHTGGPRNRLLRAEPYTQKEAEAAVGLRTENGKNNALAVASEEQPAVMEIETAGI